MQTFSLAPFISEPAETYRSKRADYLTSHQLIDYANCPLLYRQRQSGLIAESFREAYLIGSATHTMILECVERFWAEYVVGGPINPTTGRPFGSDTKKFREWAKEQGKAALSDEQYALICQLYNAVKGHELACELLREGIAEGVLRTEYNGLACQARMDWFSPAYGIIDLKTCENISTFEEDAQRYGYVRQMAFYQVLYSACANSVAPVHLIAVEKKEPYRCGVWYISQAALDNMALKNEASMRSLTVSRRDNVWPTHYEELRTLAA